jgi:murein DD-endopeptidase MepM/ murein hydrolase activator NlpD
VARRAFSLAAAVLAALGLAAASSAAAPGTAALQIALRERGLYAGRLDGVLGQATVRALLELQRRAKIAETGRLNPATRRALGRLGRHLPGTRTVTVGASGWDVSWLEFMLAKRGFDPGRIDGRFDGNTKAAALAYARFAGIVDRCHAHPSLFRALRRSNNLSSPLRLEWPLDGPVTRSFGIHGARLRTGIELGVTFGTAIAAAHDGRVVYAGHKRTLGLVVMLKHSHGVATVYGHLARIDVHLGDAIEQGALIGLVGKTGRTSVPSLYFEVRLRGASVDPLSALS